MSSTSSQGNIPMNQNVLATQEVRNALAKDYPDIEFDYSHATRMPIAEIATLGTTFSTLPEALRTATSSINLPAAENLFTATDQFGNPITASDLFRFKDGSGLLGSFKDVSNDLAQARLHEVGSQTAQVTTTMPINLTSVFMAAAIMEVNRKLDAIQETQNEMLEYLKQRDKAELRANLIALSDILANYQYNWDNETYKKAKYAQVLDIRKSAETSILHLRAQINSALEDKELVHFHKDAEKKLDKVLDAFKEYQLALHTYSLSAFLEVMLLGNFDGNYLESVAAELDDHALRYRVLYTRCYDTIEGLSQSSVGNKVLSGIANAGNALGGFLASTSLGEHTLIDEALTDKSKDIEQAKDNATERLMERIHSVKSSDSSSFAENIRAIDRLYNTPTVLLCDKENLYLLPAK